MLKEGEVLLTPAISIQKHSRSMLGPACLVLLFPGSQKGSVFQFRALSSILMGNG
jgi:hypothetical protein